MSASGENNASSNRAGDVEYFPSGHQTYLAPLPLPTSEHPFCPYISGYNDTFLDFGGGEPNVFSYQIWLGGPFTCSCLVAFGGPLLGGLFGIVFGNNFERILQSMAGIYGASSVPALGMWLLGSFIFFFVWLYHHNLFTKVIPTRFNRQRREVCFMPDGATEPSFVPWESLSAWVVQAQGATQYGVTRQYGMGMGFEHEGELVRVEFQCGSLQLAISNWEAVRGYMEYELNE